jgi:hypothetical protein
MVVIVMLISIPIALAFPAMFSRVPPLMTLIPTTVPLGIQIPTPFVRLVAVLATLLDRSVQSCFRLFNRMLAPSSVVGMRRRCCDQG